MNINNLKVELDPRFDSKGNIFHLGRMEFPGRINLKKGATFLIFISEEGDEELQIATNDKANTTFSKYSRRSDRLKVSIDTRQDQYNKTFYVAKVQFNGYINCGSEVVFIVFTSKKGSEELQIVGNIISEGDKNKDEDKSIETEVIHTRVG